MVLTVMCARACAANGAPVKGGRNVRTYENGFAIEELARGQPTGKLAKPGKKARAHATWCPVNRALGGLCTGSSSIKS